MSDFDPWRDPAPTDWQNQPPPQSSDPFYAQTGYPQPTQTNGLAIASLVCGILVFFCFISWIPALILGYMARNQINASGGSQSGRELATIGIVLGYIGLALTVLGILFFVLALVLAISPTQMLR